MFSKSSAANVVSEGKGLTTRLWGPVYQRRVRTKSLTEFLATKFFTNLKYSWLYTSLFFTNVRFSLWIILWILAGILSINIPFFSPLWTSSVNSIKLSESPLLLLLKTEKRKDIWEKILHLILCYIYMNTLHNMKL